MRRNGLLAAFSLVLTLAGCARSHAEVVSDEPMSFVRHGRVVRSVRLSALARRFHPRVVATDDAYYGHHKRFRAMPLEPILVHVFHESASALRRHSFVLHARDGYAVPIDGERLLEGGAYIAVDDVDHPGFAPIGPQQVSPAPAYLVWTRTGQSNLETHPRPWQLTSIEIASFESLYPHTVPAGEAQGSPAMVGFDLFRDRCIRCHAVNREGGRVGPDLNVPMSITEYRPDEQIRAYIRNPRTFRYGAMPPHPDLRDGDLDALLAYLHAMASRKHDRDADAGIPP